MALLMQKPTSMENSVSRYSYLSCRRMMSGVSRFHCRLWMISEWRNRLWGMTTAPRTLMTTGSEPVGRAGVSQPATAAGQSRWTRASSNTNDSPISDTKPMMIRSTRR